MALAALQAVRGQWHSAGGVLGSSLPLTAPFPPLAFRFLPTATRSFLAAVASKTRALSATQARARSPSSASSAAGRRPCGAAAAAAAGVGCARQEPRLRLLPDRRIATRPPSDDRTQLGRRGEPRTSRGSGGRHGSAHWPAHAPRSRCASCCCEARALQAAEREWGGSGGSGAPLQARSSLRSTAGGPRSRSVRREGAEHAASGEASHVTVEMRKTVSWRPVRGS